MDILPGWFSSESGCLLLKHSYSEECVCEQALTHRSLKARDEAAGASVLSSLEQKKLVQHGSYLGQATDVLCVAFSKTEEVGLRERSTGVFSFSCFGLSDGQWWSCSGHGAGLVLGVGEGNGFLHLSPWGEGEPWGRVSEKGRPPSPCS